MLMRAWHGVVWSRWALINTIVPHDWVGLNCIQTHVAFDSWCSGNSDCLEVLELEVLGTCPSSIEAHNWPRQATQSRL